jgi:hypothetical protein
MEKRISEHQYNENMSDDDFFFFNAQKSLGSGTEADPVRIMMTSRALMDNCKYLDRGVFQIDGTYRLCKNNFPWIGNQKDSLFSIQFKVVHTFVFSVWCCRSTGAISFNSCHDIKSRN